MFVRIPCTVGQSQTDDGMHRTLPAVLSLAACTSNSAYQVRLHSSDELTDVRFERSNRTYLSKVSQVCWWLLGALLRRPFSKLAPTQTSSISKSRDTCCEDIFLLGPRPNMMLSVVVQVSYTLTTAAPIPSDIKQTFKRKVQSFNQVSYPVNKTGVSSTFTCHSVHSESSSHLLEQDFLTLSGSSRSCSVCCSSQHRKLSGS
jgi:hypothetical protein